MNKVIRFLGELFWLNVLFVFTVLLSLGVFTGPALSALLKVSKAIVDKEADFYDIHRIYFKAFKKSFRYGFIFSLLIIVMLFMILTNLENIEYLQTIYPKTLLLILQYYILFQLVTGTLTFYYLNGNYQFEKFSDLARMSFYLSNRHFITTLFMIGTISIFSYLVVTKLNLTLIIICFSAFAIWISLLWKPIIKKYHKLEN